MARPSEPENNTIARIRVECADAGALRNVLRVLEGAMGKPVNVSKPYPNRDSEGQRVYMEWIVPCAAESEKELCRNISEKRKSAEEP